MTPDVNEASPYDAVNDGAFPFFNLPQEIQLEIIERVHEIYVAKEKHDEPHPLTNLRL